MWEAIKEMLYVSGVVIISVELYAYLRNDRDLEFEFYMCKELGEWGFRTEIQNGMRSVLVELVKVPTQKELIHVSPLEASIWFDAVSNNLVKVPTPKELIDVSPLETSIWLDAMDNNLVKGCMVLWVIWTVLVVCAKFWK